MPYEKGSYPAASCIISKLRTEELAKEEQLNLLPGFTHLLFSYSEDGGDVSLRHIVVPPNYTDLQH
jgi:hypothetical protein